MSNDSSSLNNDYHITTDQSRFNFQRIFNYLSGESYWSEGIPEETLIKSITNSLCFGVFYKTEQIGFARVITDRATFAYLADVYIESPYRGKGLSRQLMDTIMNHAELQDLRRWMLATRDAHGLYEKFGFKALSNPGRLMEIVDPDIYKKGKKQ